MADYELYKRDWSTRNMYASSTITDKSSWEGLVHFNPQKREFSPLLNIPRPPYSMLGYNLQNNFAHKHCAHYTGMKLL